MECDDNRSLAISFHRWFVVISDLSRTIASIVKTNIPLRGEDNKDLTGSARSVGAAGLRLMDEISAGLEIAPKVSPQRMPV
jgi:hypothetical protein